MTDIRERNFEEVAASMGVPGHTVGGLVRYIVYGTPTGQFLEAVLTNDLLGALRHADFSNRTYLHNTVLFLFNQAPLICYGSPEAYRQWIASGGLVGREKAAGLAEMSETTE